MITCLPPDRESMRELFGCGPLGGGTTAIPGGTTGRASVSSSVSVSVGGGKSASSSSGPLGPGEGMFGLSGLLTPGTARLNFALVFFLLSAAWHLSDKLDKGSVWVKINQFLTTAWAQIKMLVSTCWGGCCKVKKYPFPSFPPLRRSRLASPSDFYFLSKPSVVAIAQYIICCNAHPFFKCWC